MASTVTIRACNQYNERFAPPGAKKAYLARITGRDSKTTFAREFLAKDSDFDAASCPVLLDRRNVDSKGRADESDFILLLAQRGDDVIQCDVDKSDAMWLASQLDAGRSLDSCWDAESNKRITAVAAVKAAITATIDTAAEACWAILSALPTKEATKVLAELKKRLHPPATPTPDLKPAAEPETTVPASVSTVSSPTT